MADSRTDDQIAQRMANKAKRRPVLNMQWITLPVLPHSLRFESVTFDMRIDFFDQLFHHDVDIIEGRRMIGRRHEKVQSRRR